MKENLHDIDKLFTAALDDTKENPPEAVWEAIDKKLDKNKVIDINKKYIQLKRIAIALLILLIGAGVYTFTTFKTSSEHANNNSTNKEQKAGRNNISQSKIKQGKISEPTTVTATENSRVNKADSNAVAILQKQKNKTGITEEINKIKNKEEHHTEKKSVNAVPESINDWKEAADNTAFAAFSKTSKQTANSILNNNNSRKIRTNKGAQKSIIKSGNIENLAAENFKPLIQNKAEITMEQLAVVPAINPEKIRPVFKSHLLVISANNLFKNSSIKQSLPLVIKHKINAPSFAATVFFAPNISSINLKDDNQEHRWSNRPDNDDKDRIREGEQHQKANTFGILLDYNINQHWSLQSGISLTNKTILIKPKTIYADKDDNGAVKYLYDCSSGYAFLSSKSVVNPTVGDSLQAFESTNKLRYLSIPLAVKYTWAFKKIDVFASVGTAINILTKGQLETEIEDGLSKQATVINKINGLKSTYWGGNIGIGAAYNFNEKFALSFTPVFNFALASSTNGGVVKTYPNSIGLAAGIRYKL